MANAEDALLINLRIIAQVKPHEKINAKEKLLSIEGWGWIPLGISRYWRADNRAVLLRRVVEIIEECKGHCKTCKVGNDHVRMRRFLTHLSQTIPGLLNLRQTYAIDQQSVAHLELLIEYVKEILNNNKFSPRKWHNDRAERIVAMNELPHSSDSEDGAEVAANISPEELQLD